MVVRCDEVPARLCAPRRVCDTSGEGIHAPGTCESAMNDASLAGRRRRTTPRIDRDRGTGSRPAEEGSAAPVPQEAGRNQTADRLTLVRRESGDVYQRLDLVVGASFCDNNAAVRMADKDDRTLLSVDELRRRRHVALSVIVGFWTMRTLKPSAFNRS